MQALAKSSRGVSKGIPRKGHSICKSVEVRLYTDENESQQCSASPPLPRNYQHQTPLQSALKPRAKSWFASPGPRCILGHVVFSRGRKFRSGDHYRVPPRGVALRRVRWALSFTPEDSIRPTAITRTGDSLIDRKVLKVRIRRSKPVLFGFVGWRNGVIFI